MITLLFVICCICYGVYASLYDYRTHGFVEGTKSLICEAVIAPISLTLFLFLKLFELLLP